MSTYHYKKINKNILHQSKFHLFEQLGIAPDQSQLRDLLNNNNAKSLNEKTIIGLINYSLIPEDMKDMVIVKSIDKNWFDAIKMLIRDMDTLNREYSNYINSVPMFDYLSDKIINIKDNSISIIIQQY